MIKKYWPWLLFAAVITLFGLVAFFRFRKNRKEAQLAAAAKQESEQKEKEQPKEEKEALQQELNYFRSAYQQNQPHRLSNEGMKEIIPREDDEEEEPKKKTRKIKPIKEKTKPDSSAEREAFRAASQADTIKAYQAFLAKDFPTKTCRGLAQRAINKLKNQEDLI